MATARADSIDRRTRPQTSISYVRSNGISQSLVVTPLWTRWPVIVLSRFPEKRCADEPGIERDRRVEKTAGNAGERAGLVDAGHGLPEGLVRRLGARDELIEIRIADRVATTPLR